MKRSLSRQSKGFTLIEIMISISLFTVAILLGVGALVSSNDISNKTSDSRAVVDSLGFVMEDITRSLRLGSLYECVSNIGNISGSPRDCSGGGPIISFEPVNGDRGSMSDQIVYLIDSANGPTNARVMKSVSGGSGPFFEMTPPDVKINAQKSGFLVTGSAVSGQQPRVVIRLSGVVKSGKIESPFNIQTTVSQRQFDI